MISDSATINYEQSLSFSEPLELSQPDLPSTQSAKRSALLVAATGLGKTEVFAGIAGHWPIGRVMMISHRFELNRQAITTFQRRCGCAVDFEQAGYHADQCYDLSPIVVASVQTLCSRSRGQLRMEKFRPPDFGLLIIDEAHHSTSVSYRKIIDYFRQNPELKILGVTATPDRLDGVGLGHVFEQVVCDLNMRWGVENGWLVPVRQKYVQIDGLDLRNVRTRAGDLDEKQLAQIVQVEQNLHEMGKPIADACRDRQGIVFTVSVEQAHRLAEVIERYLGRPVGAIDGETPALKRKDILDSYAAGDTQVLVNCAVFLEGFDSPNTSVIAMARPTKSRALYCQAIGRGTRPLPGVVDPYDLDVDRLSAISVSPKPDCLVLDFVGQAGRHKLVATGDILAGPNEPPDIVERAKSIMRGGFSGTTLEALLAAKEEARKREEAKRKKVTVGVQYQLHDSGAGYSSIPQVFCPGYLKHRPATDKQIKLLKKLGYTDVQCREMNPRSASAAIDYAVGHPRTSFARWLHEVRKREGKLG